MVHITFSQHSDETSTDTKNDQAMEHKIADEIDEVLGRANQKDPDADIILTEYNSDGEEDVDTVGWVVLPWDKIPSDIRVKGSEKIRAKTRGNHWLWICVRHLQKQNRVERSQVSWPSKNC